MLYSKEDALKLAVPVAEDETAKLSFGHLPWDDVAGLRQASGLEADRLRTGEPSPDIEEFDREVHFRDGHKMPARIFRPRRQSATGFPLLIHYHGGGWVTGSYLQGVPMLRRLAEIFNLIAIALPYRLAPEHRFPGPQFDAYDGLKWTIDNSQDLGIDTKQGFIVSGASAGGQLAAVCTQNWLHNQELPPITGMYLHIPWILAQNQVPEQYQEYFNSPYQEEMKDTPMLNAQSYKVLDEYLKPDYKSEWHSPFMAADPHVGMPPVYFQICGRDPVRDHALIYEDALSSAGVKTKLDVYPGLFHGFPALLPKIPQTAAFLEDQKNGVAFLLGRDRTSVKAAE